MEEIQLKIITFAHILFVLFIVVTPFTNSNYLLLLHSIMVPFIIFHWITNNNICVLTVLEKNIKKNLYKENYKEEECFTCRLIEPVYDFVDDNKTFSKIIYIVTIMLWLISTGKLVYKYNSGEITNWKQFFIM